jgi:hypothetical protein
MAVRDDFTAGEVLAAADLNDTFASKPPFAYGTATPTTTVEGFIWYDENDTPPAPKFWDGAAFETFGGGKILQVASVTKINSFSTTATAFTDVTDLTLTITPSSTSNKILVMAMLTLSNALTIYNTGARVIRGASTVVSGQTGAYGDIANLGERNGAAIYMLLDSPATVSATTYTVQIRNEGGSTSAATLNSLGGLGATSSFTVIEVAA